MKLEELALKINARLYPSAGACSLEVRNIHASDTMSSLIANASRDTLLVTTLNNNQLIRIAELMDAPGLCLVGGVQPGPELAARAGKAGAVILVSPYSLEETRRRLEECLASEAGGSEAGREAGLV